MQSTWSRPGLVHLHALDPRYLKSARTEEVTWKRGTDPKCARCGALQVVPRQTRQHHAAGRVLGRAGRKAVVVHWDNDLHHQDAQHTRESAGSAISISMPF
jgi:hypothetical protein